ncbi:7,8-didemethyl-8-hydroxy-5-deazariboflavin synthase subunit CofG [Spirulina sp. CS-785/01]|uniref:7,8-didemethyl-8-hydroxy-5-deazariboflavin synthase subunit CofG n=1 Tax=Spirulina sp. CS-785/01 TaxID=3021716 RepID=UPI0023302CE9|nr:7,8-didemethyl-8-hydroxy-5-deazariboflavin synthase subunit CofG [Spirulina sp. CS-785/01]MDB9311753.1 7,8-didemethyl-8-hydroxy-5-deazariboflavin synthase subunit CofG [Spirulina sp. CS-785/01]
MSRVITYSPAYTLVPTYECFNRCEYCNFRTDPGEDAWLSLTDAEDRLRSLQDTGVMEILLLSGEVHPKSPRRNAWFQHLYQLAELALSLGFLPHTNAGILSFAEMEQLKEVNVSMGLMLEQLTPRLLETVHRHAPSKIPQVRLEQLEWAGVLQIPFTTGLLLGIGETEEDWGDSLRAIAQLQHTYGHIQEVILQPHSPGSQQNFPHGAFSPETLLQVIPWARKILPDTITIQIPPNLLKDESFLLACLDAGARDLGGLSPKDEVNPDYPHPTPSSLAKILHPAGWDLTPRLPVYPQYLTRLPPQLQEVVGTV